MHFFVLVKLFIKLMFHESIKNVDIVLNTSTFETKYVIQIMGLEKYC